MKCNAGLAGRPKKYNGRYKTFKNKLDKCLSGTSSGHESNGNNDQLKFPAALISVISGMFCDSLVTSTAKFLIMTVANLDITNKTVRTVILELFVQKLARAGLVS